MFIFYYKPMIDPFFKFSNSDVSCFLMIIFSCFVHEQCATPNKKNCFRGKLYSLSIWIFVIAKCLNVHELKNKVLYSVIWGTCKGKLLMQFFWVIFYTFSDCWKSEKKSQNLTIFLRNLNVLFSIKWNFSGAFTCCIMF